MNTCMCGDLVRPGSVRCPRCAALAVLGLEADATENEIRSAYRTLVKVWHPDRLESDGKLKGAAEQKLKERQLRIRVSYLNLDGARSVEAAIPSRRERALS